MTDTTISSRTLREFLEEGVEAVSVAQLERLAWLEDRHIQAEEAVRRLLARGVQPVEIARAIARADIDWDEVGASAHALIMLGLGDPVEYPEGGAPAVVRELVRALAEGSHAAGYAWHRRWDAEQVRHAAQAVLGALSGLEELRQEVSCA